MLRESTKNKKPKDQVYELPLDRHISYVSMVDLVFLSRRMCNHVYIT